MSKATLAAAVVSAALLGSTALLTIAGPLSPPAGPVASTYRTLTEVEPRTPISATTTPGDGDSLFRIIQPGSYFLTGNLAGVAGRHGIEIAASDVAIDLMGFTLQGVPGSLDGIRTSGTGYFRITVRRGVVAGFGGAGVHLSANECRVEGVTASENGESGILAVDGSIVVDCIARDNAEWGIRVYQGGVIQRCSASGNAGGIHSGVASTVTASGAYQNSASGFEALESVITACIAYDNGDHGFELYNASTITDCAARLNDLDGIRIRYYCVVRANACTSNGSNNAGANIRAVLANSRIEANNCSGGSRGIDADTDNFITRNTCATVATPYFVAAGNVCLAVSATTNAVAINGASGGAPIGSTDPNANFSF